MRHAWMILCWCALLVVARGQWVAFDGGHSVSLGAANSFGTSEKGDIDGDGALEVVWTTQVPDGVVVATIHDDGMGGYFTFRSLDWMGHDPSGSPGGRSLHFADLDGDGCDDLLVGTPEGLQILMADPLGAGADLVWSQTVEAPSAMPGAPVAVRGVTAFDFNGDGVLDLAVRANDNMVHFYTGAMAPMGSPAPVDYTLTDSENGFRVNHMATIDWNGDGLVDLIGGAFFALRIFLRDAGPGDTFTDSGSFSLNADITTLRVADLDGDGDADDLVAYGNPNASNPTVFTLVKNGAGLWVAQSFVPANQFMFGDVGDLDGDGLDDVVCSDTVHKPRLLRSLGGGLLDEPYQSEITQAPTTNCPGAILLDANDDGLLDVACGGPGALRLWLREPCYGVVATPSPASCGEPTTLDLTGWTPPAGMPASHAWDFGDGSPGATTPTATHTYAAPGTYVVTVCVTYGDPPLVPTVVYELCLSLDVGLGSNAPTAFAGGPYASPPGAAAQLAGSGNDPDAACGDVLTYAWDLDDDGLFGDATGAAPLVPWPTLQSLGLGASGAYTIRLQVTDSTGSSHVDTTTLVIDDPNFPGTGDELVMLTALGSAPPNALDTKTAPAGALYTIAVESPTGLFTGRFLYLGGSLFLTGGMVPPGIGAPGIYLGPASYLIVGFTTALGSPVLPPTGYATSFLIPPGVAGASVLFQALVAPTSLAANGIYAATDGHVVELQ